MRDLFLRAKHLFVAATFTPTGVTRGELARAQAVVTELRRLNDLQAAEDGGEVPTA